MKLFQYLKLGYHTIKLLFNPEKNIKSLIFLGDHIAESKSSKIIAKKIFENEDLAVMYEKKQGLDTIDLSILSSYPEESLGYSLYEFYTTQNLDVYPMGRFSEYSRSRYISERTRKSHDILHVILGYGTDMIGEAKVNAYVLSQTRVGISFLIIASIGIQFLLKSPRRFRSLLDGIEEGWNIGYCTEFFITQDWEALMKLPLAQVRARFIKNNMIATSPHHIGSRQVA